MNDEIHNQLSQIIGFFTGVRSRCDVSIFRMSFCLQLRLWIGADSGFFVGADGMEKNLWTSSSF